MPHADIENRSDVIGENIRRYRHAKGLRQEELCAGLCSVGQLSKIEHGKAQLKADQLREFAVRLGVTVRQLTAADAWLDELEERRKLAGHAYTDGKFHKAIELIRDVIEHCESNHYSDLLQDSVLFEARSLYQVERFDEMIIRLERALALGAMKKPVPNMLARVELGRAWAAAGNMGAARLLVQSADADFARSPVEEQDMNYLRLLYRLGQGHVLMRNYRLARCYAEEAVQVATQLERLQWEVQTQILFGEVLMLSERYAEAEGVVAQARAAAAKNTLIDQQGAALHLLGRLEMRQGRLLDASVSFQKALAQFELLEQELPACAVRLSQAELAVREGRPAAAEQFAADVAHRAGQMVGVAYLYQARALRVLGRLDGPQGVEPLREAATLFQAKGATLYAAETFTELADRLADRQEADASLYYRKAALLYRTLHGHD